MDGATLLANSLYSQGIRYAFGIVGVPVVEVAEAFSANGIIYIGMRNEQSAAYAASAVGFMTGIPGVCLCVSGPGVLHALGGLANSQENCWPMILVGGASDISQQGMGAFQEYPQVEACRPFTKFSARPGSMSQIPAIVERAVRYATYGRPGACYIDMPADFINGTIQYDLTQLPPKLPPPPKSLACPIQIGKAVELFKTAKNPLFIIGKGAAYARAEKELKSLVELLNVPFLPTPMGKGVIDDDHPNCMAAARSFILKSADVIFLIGARLNWILHFGKPPRFLPNVKIVQLDFHAEEFGSNTDTTTSIFLKGDIQLVTQQLLGAFKGQSLKTDPKWLSTLKAKAQANVKMVQELKADSELPMNYYRAFAEVEKFLPHDCYLVSEGANTMDIGRGVIKQRLPRHRLDAGTFGTMGVGLGFAIAAQIANPSQRVVCIEGDSAFGFSGMEIETCARYKLPIVFIIFNNNGIFSGLDKDSFASMTKDGGKLMSNVLLPNANYEKLADAFHCKGKMVQTPEELHAALKQAFSEKCTWIINILINPYGTRKPQEFAWLTKNDAKL